MLAKDAARPHLRRVLWRGYARRPVDDLVTSVQRQLGPVPEGSFAVESWEKLAPVDREPALVPLRSGWLGYAKSDVDFWRFTLAGAPTQRTGPALAADLVVRSAIVIGTSAILVAVGPSVLAVALAAYFVVVAPLLGVRTYRAISYRLRVAPEQRARTLVLAALARWSFVAVLAILGAAAARGRGAIFLATPHWDVETIVAMFCALALIAVMYRVIYRLGFTSVETTRSFARNLRRVAALLPRTRADRAAFALVSVTAGIVEELLYRGFGIALVVWADPHASHLEMIWLTAAAFGLAHVYQGVRGLVATTLVGAAFAWLTIATGSLLPAMFLHALLDLRMCIVPADYVNAV